MLLSIDVRSICSCRENLQLLRQRYYYATWKADGTRYMMLITGDGCYLIDRKFLFQRISMRFPCRYSKGVYIFIYFTFFFIFANSFYISGNLEDQWPLNYIFNSLLNNSWMFFLFNHITFKGTPERNHHYTLLDGEMIIDMDPHTHKQERRYLIYDLIAINQVSLTQVHTLIVNCSFKILPTS